MSKETDYFFVYGTLKVGGYFSFEFEPFRLLSIPATLEGYDLFDLGSFPAIKEGKGKVIGELHKYKGLSFVQARIDQIEGYNAEHPPGSLYLRKRRNVKTEEGNIIEANVYVFNDDIPLRARRIENGIWKI